MAGCYGAALVMDFPEVELGLYKNPGSRKRDSESSVAIDTCIDMTQIQV
jgi:hypothetical protein